MDTGASAENDLQTNAPEPSGPTFVQASLPEQASASTTSESDKPVRPAAPQSKPSALDTIKDKLLSALPSGAGTAMDDAQKKAAQLAEKDVEIGIMGILHPTVLGSFELEYPCSVFEFTLEGL